MQLPARELFSYRKYWASRFGTAPFLPMSREEMEALGWDSCDIIIVTGDAYVDHPSFGMAIVGRVLEAQGFRVGIIAQPDWRSAKDFERLGKHALPAALKQFAEPDSDKCNRHHDKWPEPHEPTLEEPGHGNAEMQE